MASESPPKRRRLSTEAEAEGAAPGEGAEGEDTQAPRSNRPSFTSPTKASLARFNPRLLPPKQKSPERPRSAEPSRTGSARRDTAGSGSGRRDSAIGGGFAVGPRRQSQSQRPSAPAAEPPEKRLSSRTRRLEPDLPPTPEALGLAPRPAQPQGLLSSSPAARASKRKGTGTGAGKASPLKSRQLQGNAPVQVPETETEVEKEQLVKEEEELSKETIRKQAELRGLQERLQLVRDDVSYLERAVTALEESQGKSFGFVSENKILSILTSTDPNHERPLSTAMPLSAKLAQFLPFSRPRAYQQSLAELERIGDAPLHDAYRPVEAEELAVKLGIEPRVHVSVQRFIAVESLTSGPLVTKRSISLSDPAGLLRMDLAAAVVEYSIASVTVESLSTWAESEFGAWAREIAKTGDLPALGRGFGAYWTLSVARATCWARCAATHGALLHDPIVSAGGESRSDVHAHLGRSMLQLTRRGASLLIRWDLTLDWAGNAQSQVKASCALPATWRDEDKRGSFALLGDAFRRLVKDRGVERAVGVLVGVVLGNDDEERDTAMEEG